MYLVQLLISSRLLQKLLTLLYSESESQGDNSKNDWVFKDTSKELNDMQKVIEDLKEELKRDQHTEENHLEILKIKKNNRNNCNSKDFGKFQQQNGSRMRM